MILISLATKMTNESIVKYSTHNYILYFLFSYLISIIYIILIVYIVMYGKVPINKVQVCSISGEWESPETRNEQTNEYILCIYISYSFVCSFLVFTPPSPEGTFRHPVPRTRSTRLTTS